MPNKRKVPIPSKDTENQDKIQEVVNDTTFNSATKNRDGVAAKKSQVDRSQQKEYKKS